MVASASRGGLNGSPPLQSFYQMYSGGLDSLSQTYEPAAKNFARDDRAQNGNRTIGGAKKDDEDVGADARAVGLPQYPDR